MVPHALVVAAGLHPRAGLRIEAAVTVACSCGEVLDVFAGPVEVAVVRQLHEEHVQAHDLITGCELLLAGIE